MNDIYTLFKIDFFNSADEFTSLLEEIADSNVFDSTELKEYLDQFKLKTPERLVKKIKSFQQSSLNLQFKFPEIREVTLN